MVRKNKGRSITGFRFFDRDPMVYVVEEARERSGLSYRQIAENSNGMVKEGTLRNWEAGKTRSPINRTLTGAMIGAGFRCQWVNGEHIIEPVYSGTKYESDRPFIVHRKPAE